MEVVNELMVDANAVVLDVKVAVGINEKAEYFSGIANIFRVTLKDDRNCREEVPLLDTKDPEKKLLCSTPEL